MSHKSILTEKSPTNQFLFRLGFFLYFSKPVLKHIEEFIEGSTQKGYHLIGALKTNRVIYPKGVGLQIKQFAQYIEKNDVCLVTVNNCKYWVYRYEGHLNGVDNAIVLLCWHESVFKREGVLHAFLCTDTELDNQTILEYYSRRWPIETFFRQTKNNLGLNTYQVRSPNPSTGYWL